MDLDVLRQVVAELESRIIGARIAKIHQPSAELLVLRLWTGSQNLKLLIAATAQDSRIHLTEQAFPNPFTPPRFCQLLRARVSRISGVKQLNEDRIVEISCQGPKGESRLIVELTGRSSNLILVDAAGRIIDVLKRQPESRNAPGKQYLLPERKQTQGKEETVSDFGTTDVNAVVEKLYSDKAETGDSTDLRLRLKKIIEKETKKLTKRLSKIKQEQDRQQDYEHYRQYGDLLLANLYQINRGMPEVVVSDYYQDPPVDVTIPLDSRLTPQDNADKYFRKYKKARRGLEHSARRIHETTDELNWLEDVGYHLHETEIPADTVAIADELKKAGLLKDKVSRLPRSANLKTPLFRELTTPGGHKVLWGTNSKQNDYLSTRMLKKGDLWFHAHGCPGSHVVLKAESGQQSFTEVDIEYAASIAAANSKAKHADKVEVMMAEAKTVKKPTGARTGMVTVQQYKSLVVQPFSQEPEVF